MAKRKARYDKTAIEAVNRLGAGMESLIKPQTQDDYAARWAAAWADIAKYCLGPHNK